MADFVVGEDHQIEEPNNKFLPLDENGKLLITEKYLLTFSGNEIGEHLVDIWDKADIDENMNEGLIMIMFLRLVKAFKFIKEKSNVWPEFVQYIENNKEGKSVRINGIAFSVGKKPTYYYNECNHPLWDELDKAKKQLEAELKPLTPKNSKDAKTYDYIDKDTGEHHEFTGPLVKVSEFPRSTKFL